MRHVLEQAEQVDLLLVVAAQTEPGLLADDRDHRLMVELGVVEPVQEVDRARPGGCQADARLARELRVRAGHERRHLLVANLDELGSPLSAPEGADDPVDAVSGIAVYALHAPLASETFKQVISDALAHDCSGRRSRSQRRLPAFPLPPAPRNESKAAVPDR